MVAGGAKDGWDAVEPLEEHHVVPDVGVVHRGIGRVDEAGVGSEASGAHTGSTAEGIHLEAGVIGENQLTGRESRVVDGLGCSVGRKVSPSSLGAGIEVRLGRGSMETEWAAAAVRKSRSLP